MYSIIMTTHHNPEYLKLCIDSILENSYYKTHQFCIHVNGYDKESINYLDNRDIKYITTKEIGSSEAMNLCIDQVNYDNVLTISDDCYFTKHWDYYLHQWEIELNDKFPDYSKIIGYRWCEPNFGSFPPICDAGKNIDEFNLNKLNEYISKNSTHDMGKWMANSLYPTEIISKCRYSPEFYTKGNDLDQTIKMLKYLKDNSIKFLIFSVKDCCVYHFQRIASSKSKIPGSSEDRIKLFRTKWDMNIQDALIMLNNEVQRSILLVKNFKIKKLKK